MDQKIKIMDLTLWTPVDTDFIPFVDVSDTTQSAAGSTKRALKSELKWDTGDNATATAWTTTTGVPWSSANVTNVWTTSDAIFNFTIPRWDVWSQGIQGIQGIQWVAGTDWESFTWLGAYSGATGYVVNDVVSYNGSSYICILESTGNLPTNVTYWAVMALKGTDGIGTGDVVWPASSVNNNVATFDGTTWKLIKDSWLSLSGTNTWDETTATIKSKLSITTLSGSNTGDQTSIVGITWTLAQFNTACTDADFATWWGTATGSNTGDNSPNTNSWLVHTTGTETIAGVKTFSDEVKITYWIWIFNDWFPTIPALKTDWAFPDTWGSDSTRITPAWSAVTSNMVYSWYVRNGSKWDFYVEWKQTVTGGQVLSWTWRLLDIWDDASFYDVNSDNTTALKWIQDATIGRLQLWTSAYVQWNGDGSMNLNGTVITSGWIELWHATDTTISRVSAGVIAVEGVSVPTISSTSTITNKRNQPRIVSAASYTTDTGTSLDFSICDIFIVTAQAGALKFNNPSGTPQHWEKIIIRCKDNWTARALTYDTQYRAIGVTLPTTTVISKTLYLGGVWNTTDTKLDIIAVAQEV